MQEGKGEEQMRVKERIHITAAVVWSNVAQFRASKGHPVNQVWTVDVISDVSM